MDNSIIPELARAASAVINQNLGNEFPCKAWLRAALSRYEAICAHPPARLHPVACERTEDIQGASGRELFASRAFLSVLGYAAIHADGAWKLQEHGAFPAAALPALKGFAKRTHTVMVSAAQDAALPVEAALEFMPADGMGHLKVHGSKQAIDALRMRLERDYRAAMAATDQASDTAQPEGAVIERLRCVLDLTREALEMVVCDTESTYNAIAAGSGAKLEISLGQWRRLAKAKTRMTSAPQDGDTANASEDGKRMPQNDWTHELKTDSEVFDAVVRGEKTHEIRRNDRNFLVGDTLILRETRYTGQEMSGPEPRPLVYTGRTETRVVSHVLEGYGLQPGWAILSFAPTPDAQAPVALPGTFKKFQDDMVKKWGFCHWHAKEAWETLAAPIASALSAQEVEPAAWRDVKAERQRQVSVEGWTPEHDDEHEIGELARAAACYAANATGFRLQNRANLWPWDHAWWKPTTPRRDLEKAGALILGEIERLDRKALPTAQPKEQS